MHALTHTHMHTYTHTFIHTLIHLCPHAHAYARTPNRHATPAPHRNEPFTHNRHATPPTPHRKQQPIFRRRSYQHHTANNKPFADGVLTNTTLQTTNHLQTAFFALLELMTGIACLLTVVQTGVLSWFFSSDLVLFVISFSLVSLLSSNCIGCP
jgi:hypothetical protein